MPIEAEKCVQCARTLRSRGRGVAGNARDGCCQRVCRLPGRASPRPTLHAGPEPGRDSLLPPGGGSWTCTSTSATASQAPV